MNQRIIKFRAWTLTAYGGKEDDFCKPPNSMVSWEEIQDDKNKWFEEEEFGTEFILMQYTNLKDKNGKEIFESDLIGYEGKTWEVRWIGAGFWLVIPEEPKDRGLTHNTSRFMNVKGNIYEQK